MDDSLYILARRVHYACSTSATTTTPRTKLSDVQDLVDEVGDLITSFTKAARAATAGSRQQRRLQCVLAVLAEHNERLQARVRVLNLEEHEIKQRNDYMNRLAQREYAPQPRVDRGKPGYAPVD
jgi:hypothetical protein